MTKKITFKGDCPLHIATYKREDNIIPDEIYIQGDCIYIEKDNEEMILIEYYFHIIIMK